MATNNDVFWMLAIQDKLDNFLFRIVRESIMSSKDAINHVLSSPKDAKGDARMVNAEASTFKM